MEQNETPQRRVRFSELLQLQQDKEIDLKQSPTESFRAVGLSRNILRMGKKESDSIEIEFAASVTAAAFAVHSLEETRTNYQKKMMAQWSGEGIDSPEEWVHRRWIKQDMGGGDGVLRGVVSTGGGFAGGVKRSSGSCAVVD